MFYSIKIKKRKRFYLASFLDVSQEMICFLIQKRFFMKHICNTVCENDSGNNLLFRIYSY